MPGSLRRPYLTLLVGPSQGTAASPKRGVSPSGERGVKLREQRLEEERQVEVELLELAPALPDDLGCILGVGRRGAAGVLAELGETVGVHDGRLGAGGDHDEVAVPRRELLEREQDLLMLGAALCPLDMLLGRWTLDNSPAFMTADLMARVFSPYDLNPMGANPLREIIATSIDFPRLADGAIKLFVTATNVRTGRGRVFRNSELSPDVLLASACLPTLFQAVEIDGEPYWDGGYAGNPTITPLVRECRSQDTILVQINPIERPGTPRSARDILDRVNEVSFNSVLLKELRMIALLRRVAHPSDGEGARWAGMRVHRIASEVMLDLGYSSKLNAEWAFLVMLRDEGRKVADAFLQVHADNLGKRSSLDLGELLEGV